MGVFEPSKCAAVIPCYNEAAGISGLLAAVRQHVPAVVVVNDGSTDETARFAADAGATVLSHDHNRGKGAALKTGLSWALNQGYEWAVTLDGDGQHSPKELPRLFKCAQETGALLVIGNRMREAKKMSWLRRHVNRCMSWQLSLIAGQRLPDTQCGLRLIHLPTWVRMAVETEGFEVESEILMAFLAAGQRVEFMPIQVIPSNRRSYIQPLADTLRWTKWWFKLASQNFDHHPARAKIQEPASPGEMLAR
jgi:glycosyltransferase involved in cell wall biosynthesis